MIIVEGTWNGISKVEEIRVSQPIYVEARKKCWLKRVNFIYNLIINF